MKDNTEKQNDHEVNKSINLDVGDLPGVGAITAKKLSEAGYSSLNSLATAPVNTLVEEVKIGEKTAIKIIESARDAMKIGFMSGNQVWQKRKKLHKITTGSSNLDEIFGGGIETGCMIEFFGEFRTGKTQLCHQLCVNVQLSLNEFGLAGNALYIDTEGTFRPERIIQMAEGLGLDYNTVLDNITYTRIYTSDHQMMIIPALRELIVNKNIKLIVVDSLINHFRGEYIGKSSIMERQQKLNLHIHELVRLVESFSGVALVVTNQVSSNPEVFFGDPTRPAGGNILAHASAIRIYLRKGKGEQRVAKLIDAPHLPEAEVTFSITENGIKDFNI